MKKQRAEAEAAVDMPPENAALAAVAEAQKRRRRTLTERYLSAVEHCGEVKKSGHNKFDGYDYPQYVDIVEAVRVVVISEGLGVNVETLGVERSSYTSKKGAVMTNTLAKMRFVLFCDGPAGIEERATLWEGESADVSDKSLSKAQTAGFKTWLLKTFLVAVDDGTGEPDQQSPRRESDAPEPAKIVNGSGGNKSRPVPPSPGATPVNKTQPGANGASKAETKKKDPPSLEDVEKFIESIVGNADLNPAAKLWKLGQARINWNKYENTEDNNFKGNAMFDQAEALLNQGEVGQ